LDQRVLTCASIPSPGWPPDVRRRPGPRSGALPRSSLAAIGWVWSGTVSPVFVFLRPFAPPALPGFIATMNALPAARPSLRLPDLSPLMPCPFQPFPLHPTPAPTCLQYWQSLDRNGFAALAAGFAFAQQTRPWHMPYRVHFRSEPTFLLGLLPTPPCGDAVASDCTPVFASGVVMTFTF
jgi:hypothetical protein